MIIGAARKSGSGDASADKSARPSAQDRRREAAEARAALAPLRKRIKAAEEGIAKAEAEIAKRDAVLADPELYTTDPGKAARINKERARWVEAREAAEEDWLAASEAYETAEAETVLAS